MGVFWQSIKREESVVGDFHVWFRSTFLFPVANDKQGDMVAGEELEIREHGEKFGFTGNVDVGFFVQFTFQGGLDGFVLFHASAGKVPAGPIRVLDQQDAIVFGDDAALRAHGEAAGRTPIILHRLVEQMAGPQAQTGCLSFSASNML